MADLTLFDDGGARTEDGTVQMLSCWKRVLESFDAVIGLVWELEALFETKSYFSSAS